MSIASSAVIKGAPDRVLERLLEAPGGGRELGWTSQVELSENRDADDVGRICVTGGICASA